MPISALEKQMREDRERLIAEQADHLRDVERIEMQLAMLNNYLGIKHQGLVLAAEIPVEVQAQPVEAPREKRKYTRKAKGRTEEPNKTFSCPACNYSSDTAPPQGLCPKCNAEVQSTGELLKMWKPVK